jgi:hypothetical protein
VADRRRASGCALGSRAHFELISDRPAPSAFQGAHIQDARRARVPADRQP